MNIENDKRLVQVVPSERQFQYQQLEFYGFVHFTINTFLDVEHAEGNESASLFHPMSLDAEQWARSMKAAGMTGMILTCKHHDGFCLWPSKYTDYSVVNSPFRDGLGDVVKEASEACKKYGLKFGIYLSPWDRNHKGYGLGKTYDDYFVNQLNELLTGYGEIFAIWLDGCCGGGPHGIQPYDWERYFEVIRKLQPNACTSVCGEDIRWCGNEIGSSRASEWSVVPARMKVLERQGSKKPWDISDLPKMNASDIDLGSRERLENEKDLIWYPAEVDVSLRPNWFYHKEDDEKVTSLEDLKKIYYNCVGGNGLLLLNVPPNREGLFSEIDVKRLEELGDYLRKTFQTNLLKGAVLSTDHSEWGHPVEFVRTDDYDSFFKTEDGITKASIEAKWNESIEISHVVLKENIRYSQRIERFIIDVNTGVDGQESWQTVFEGTVVGYKKIIRIVPTTIKSLRIRILDARVAPTLSFLGVY